MIVGWASWKVAASRTKWASSLCSREQRDSSWAWASQSLRPWKLTLLSPATMPLRFIFPTGYARPWSFFSHSAWGGMDALNLLSLLRSKSQNIAVRFWPWEWRKAFFIRPRSGQMRPQWMLPTIKPWELAEDFPARLGDEVLWFFGMCQFWAVQSYTLSREYPVEDGSWGC